MAQLYLKISVIPGLLFRWRVLTKLSVFPLLSRFPRFPWSLCTRDSISVLHKNNIIFNQIHTFLVSKVSIIREDTNKKSGHGP